MKPKIGFIGLGLMGHAMAERLLDCGYSLTVVANRSRTAVDALVARGAGEMGTARELAAASDIVMLCVDTSASVESRMRGADGVIAGIKADAVVIDFGTSLPGSTKALGAEVAETGAHYMDAPLGRTPSHGREGKLNIMGAGDKAIFDRVKPVLDDLGENIFHLGPLGTGHTIKLLNNFVAQSHACVLAEVFAICDQAGVPRQSAYDVMSAGPLGSLFMDFMKAQAVDGDPTKLAFSIANAKKDVGYYVTMAEDLGKPTVLGNASKTALTLAASQGYAGRMVPEMVDFYASLFEDKGEA